MKNNLALHLVELSHNSRNISGGEVSLLEFIKYCQKKQAVEIIYIYTSESGKYVYSELLGDLDKTRFVVIGSEKVEKIHPYIAYYLRSIQCLFKLRKFKSQNNRIISFEHFFPTILFSAFLKIINSKATWTTVYHMKPPHLFKGFENEFINKYSIPTLKLVRLNIEEVFFLGISNRLVNLIITVNPYYSDYLSSKFGSDRIYVLNHFGGIELNVRIPKSKQYDFAWMGRFHVQKGLEELKETLLMLKAQKSDYKCVVIGGATKRAEDAFIEFVKENSLEKNIDYKGFVTGSKRLDLLSRSKVFLMTSRFESFGIVIIEALNCGLHVVAFDLPPYKVFGKLINKVESFNTVAFTQKALELLALEPLAPETLEYAKKFTWEKTSAEIYKKIT